MAVGGIGVGVSAGVDVAGIGVAFGAQADATSMIIARMNKSFPAVAFMVLPFLVMTCAFASQYYYTKFHPIFSLTLSPKV